jgi:putative endonuclease
MSRWTVYMLRCGDGTLYVGITNDLRRRLSMHETGRGAKYTRGRGPFQVVRREHYAEKGDALRRELQIKRLPRAAKLLLATGVGRRRSARSRPSR